MISHDGLLHTKQDVHGLKYDVSIDLHCILPVILHAFDNSTGNQGTVHTLSQ